MALISNTNTNNAIDAFISNSRKNVTTNDERASAKVWLNIGFISEYKDEDGKNVFISLPKGIALDTMPDVKVGNKDSDYNSILSTKNELKAMLLKAAESMAPGERQVINLSVELYKVSEPVERESTADKSGLTSLANNLFVK